MDSATLKLLNSTASFASRFGSLNFAPLVQKPLGSFIGHSPRPRKSNHPRVPRIKKSYSVTYGPPRPELSLDQVAHFATRPDFEVYPDLRSFGCHRSMFGRKIHSFLYTQKVKVDTPTVSDLICLKELNRLARLVELTPRCQTPVYHETPRISRSLSHDKTAQRFCANLLSFERNGTVSDFRTVFPGTAVPTVSMFSGQPRVNKEIFNQLLASKLSTLRSKLGTTSTPSGAPALVASWINLSLRNLLSRKSNLVAKKAAKSLSSGKKDKKTKDNASAANKTVTFVAEQDPTTSVVLPVTATETPEPSSVCREFIRSTLSIEQLSNLRNGLPTPLPYADFIAETRLGLDTIRPQLSELRAYSTLQIPPRVETLEVVLRFLAAITNLSGYPKHTSALFQSQNWQSGNLWISARPGRFEIETSGPPLMYDSVRHELLSLACLDLSDKYDAIARRI
jgi:hypothetical protein